MKAALVGDAAGIADTFAGEGMTKAVISSRVLAKCAKCGLIDYYEKEYYKVMRGHFLVSIFAYLRKNFTLLNLLGKSGILGVVNRLAVR